MGHDPAHGQVMASRRSAAACTCLALLLLIAAALKIRSNPLDFTMEKMAALRLEDLSGKPAPVLASSSVKAAVFLFMSVECPISNSYAPEFKRLAAEFTPKEVLVRLVYPNPDESAETIRRHLKEFDLPLVALRDPRHELVKMAGVRITPEAAVFVPQRGFVYRGRIDNRYAELGVARPQTTEHDLRDVLVAILNGKPVPRGSARAVGCSISPLP
jgi:hypothetical protein